MPVDFNAQSLQGMSADMVAELLLYMIAKGLVTLPVACDKALLDMPWDSHDCQFYNQKEDLLELSCRTSSKASKGMRLVCGWSGT